MSGAGKSTISDQLMARFRALGAKVELLDGDIVRTNLSQGLGFSRQDRDTNIRRIGFVAELLTRNGVIVVVAAISPYRETREEVKRKIRPATLSKCMSIAPSKCWRRAMSKASTSVRWRVK